MGVFFKIVENFSGLQTFYFAGTFIFVPKFSNMDKAQQYTTLKKALRRKGMLRLHEAEKLGVKSMTLSRLVDKGELQRLGRGLYALPDAELNEHHYLAIVSKQVPNATICLLSALSYHGMTTELPRATWIALPSKSRPPKIEFPRLEIVYMSEPSASYGIENYVIDRVDVSMSNPAKTVADCFKFRNKIGIDVAIAALKDYWLDRRGTLEELRHATDVCRVSRVIAPYLEMLTA